MSPAGGRLYCANALGDPLELDSTRIRGLHVASNVIQDARHLTDDEPRRRQTEEVCFRRVETALGPLQPGFVAHPAPPMPPTGLMVGRILRVVEVTVDRTLELPTCGVVPPGAIRLFDIDSPG